MFGGGGGANDSWARVPLAGRTVNQALEAWFYGSETPAELARGDIAVDDNFAENAVCVAIKDRVQLDVTRIRPSMDRYFIFYSQRAGTDVLDVWGGLPVETVIALRGLVLREQDLQWKPAEETRCRAMLTRLPGPTPPNTQLDVWKPHYFFFPLTHAMFQDTLQNAYPVTGHVFEVFFKRLESYTVPVQESAPFPAGSTIQERLLDKGSFFLCANLARELQLPELALSYEKARMERERILYWNRWAPFLAPGVGEFPLLGLLQYNPGLWRWLMEHSVEPTPEDEQAWFRIWPGQGMPTFWFAIPCHQVPLALGSHVRCQFPIHAGGFMHIPAYAPWIAQWIWDALVVPEAQRHFAQPPIHKSDSLLHRIGALEEARSWARRAQYPIGQGPRVGLGAAAVVHAPPPPLDEGGGLDIEELDRLWNVLPPCIRRLREEKRFPRNNERREIIEIMRLGGLSLQTMHYYFEKLNNRYPKLPKPETMEKRAQVEAVIDWWKGKKPQDAVIWCTSLINKALDVGPGREVLICPYAVGQRVPEQERPQFAGRCREQCVANSGCAGPRRQPHWLPWATPSQALKEALESQHPKETKNEIMK